MVPLLPLLVSAVAFRAAFAVPLLLKALLVPLKAKLVSRLGLAGLALLAMAIPVAMATVAESHSAWPPPVALPLIKLLARP